MELNNLGYTAIGQGIGILPVQGGAGAGVAYVPGTHTYLAPESTPIEKYREVVGDYVDLDRPLIDTASFKSISGLIILLLEVQLVLSVFICLGRTDVIFPFLVYGYYVWCLESTWSTNKISKLRRALDPSDWISVPIEEVYSDTKSLLQASNKTLKTINAYTLLMSLMSVLDLIHILVCYFSWTCVFHRDQQDPTHCLDTKHLKQTYLMHQFVLKLSLLNFCLRVSSPPPEIPQKNPLRRNRVSLESTPPCSSSHACCHVESDRPFSMQSACAALDGSYPTRVSSSRVLQVVMIGLSFAWGRRARKAREEALFD